MTRPARTLVGMHRAVRPGGRASGFTVELDIDDRTGAAGPDQRGGGAPQYLAAI